MKRSNSRLMNPNYSGEMMKHIALLVSLVTVFLTLPALLSAQTSPAYVPGQVLVRFEKPTSLEEAKSELNSSRFAVDKVLVRQLSLYLVKIIDPGLSVLDAVKLLNGYSQVKYAQADHILTERTTFPNDPSFGNEWNMNQANDADIDAPEAWDITTGGTNPAGQDIVIAIVDGGGQTDHTDLIANRWVNTGEIAGNGIDDDSNGYIDDLYGWDAYSNDGSIPVTEHATHCAGIAGAVGNNNLLVCGVNWHVKIMYVAASTSNQTSVVSIGYGYVIDQKQLWWSSGGAHGANVVATNSSFGMNYGNCASGDYPIWNDLYNQMGQEGILSACATANLNINVDTQGDVPTTCSSPYIVAVTNTTNADLKNSGAAYGQINVDLGAPGTSVYSTIPTNSASYKTGTSMATPHVCGAIAFMHAAASEDFYQDYIAYPDSLALVLKQILLVNVDTIAALRNITVSNGRLNLFRAAQAIHAYVGGGSHPNLQYDSLYVQDIPYGDGDHLLEKGETVNLITFISNTGTNATNVTAVLSESDPYITVLDSLGSFGDLPSSTSSNNGSDPFVIAADPATPLEYSALLTLTLQSAESYSVERMFYITVGEKEIYWSDSMESGQGSWTHANVSGSYGDQWHISTELASSPTHSWKCGDSEAGNYADALDAGLVSPAVTIYPQSLLSFRHWIDSEQSPGYPDSVSDGGIVEISVNGGDFTQVTPLAGYTKHFRRGWYLYRPDARPGLFRRNLFMVGSEG